MFCLHSSLEEEDVLLILTSKALMKNVILLNEKYQRCSFYIDATFKLMNNGFVLLTLGTETINHNFLLIACAISAHENTNSYKQFLLSIKNGYKSIFNFTWQPTFVVSDAADSISNSLETVFPNIAHIRCFFHASKAVKDKMTRWKDLEEKKLLKENLGLINYGMRLLHQTTSDENFMDLWKLIEKEWSSKLPKAFLKYFDKNFVENRKKLRWNRMNYLGLNLTNNGIERLHGDLKATYTEKKKLKINEFLLVCSKFIRDYSIDYEEKVTSSIEKSIAVWKKAFLLLENKERGPFYNIKDDCALFIKKKRKVSDLIERKR